MELWAWIAIVAGAVVVLFALIGSGSRLASRTGQRRRHQDELKARFGPEYELAVARQGRKDAQDVLEERLAAYEEIQHPNIGPSEREKHTVDWRQAQYRFVDSPERAVREAEHIVVTVMEQRGYLAEDASSRLMRSPSTTPISPTRIGRRTTPSAWPTAAPRPSTRCSRHSSSTASCSSSSLTAPNARTPSSTRSLRQSTGTRRPQTGSLRLFVERMRREPTAIRR